MNDRGFTLIELTAIIVVLVAIFLVSFPFLLNTARADNEKQYESMVESLCLAGKTYIYSNMSDFEEISTVGSVINIPIEDLIKYGNVDKNTLNVKTNRYVDQDLLVYTVLNDYSLGCKYKEK